MADEEEIKDESVQDEVSESTDEVVESVEETPEMVSEVEGTDPALAEVKEDSIGGTVASA